MVLFNQRPTQFGSECGLLDRQLVRFTSEDLFEIGDVSIDRLYRMVRLRHVSVTLHPSKKAIDRSLFHALRLAPDRESFLRT